ncbi:MAG: hypothetical protein JSR77_15545 [Planctomycetes bacterium]|nr:hypothetical protein [Planctomycetota bacterium]
MGLDDTLQIRIVHHSQSQFSSQIDLIQAIWTDVPIEEERFSQYSRFGGFGSQFRENTSSHRPRGGDFDYDGDVDEDDAAGFADAYLSNRRSADFDNDGEVTSADAVLFAERYGA